MAGVANTQGTNLLLNVFWGPVVNAAYSVAQQVSTVIQQFSGNFFMAIRPPLIKSYAEGNYVDILRNICIEDKRHYHQSQPAFQPNEKHQPKYQYNDKLNPLCTCCFYHILKLK